MVSSFLPPPLSPTPLSRSTSGHGRRPPPCPGARDRKKEAFSQDTFITFQELPIGLTAKIWRLMCQKQALFDPISLYLPHPSSMLQIRQYLREWTAFDRRLTLPNLTKSNGLKKIMARTPPDSPLGAQRTARLPCL